MKITLKELQLRNFKGIKSLDIKFNPDATTISGDNGTGKTTIADAFSWLLFGKNSLDAKDFNIKTLDKDNNPIHKLDHEVTGVFDIDGIEHAFKKVYKEKWQKKRGAEESEMVGHETLQYLNDVPLSATEYKAKVDGIIQEEKFKLLTNPMYFNALKWDIRRRVLLGIVGNINDTEVLDKIATIENKQEVMNLTSILNQNKSIEEYKREIAAKKKRLKDELDTIPTRIDESQRSMPQVYVWDDLQAEIDTKQQAIRNIDADIENRNEAVKKDFDRIKNLQQEKHNLEIQYNNLVNENSLSGKKELQELDNKISLLRQSANMLKQNIASHEQDISRRNNTINQLNASNDTIRKQWTEENARTLVIDESSLECPTCKRALEAEDIEAKKQAFTTNFNTDKQRNLDRLNQQGVNNKKTIEENQKQVAELQAAIEEFKVKLIATEKEQEDVELQRSSLSKTEVVPSPEQIELKAKIDAFVIPESPKVDIADLKEQKNTIATEIDVLKLKLANRAHIDTINQRIEELEKQEKNLAQQISSLEKTEFVIQAFTKAKITELETRLNDKFQIVSFRLFDMQINGQEVECCDVLKDGVPFQDVNMAGKINSGIDIINTLSEYYQCWAPIMLDQAEAINVVQPTKSQLIRLMVTTDKQLVIS